MVAVCRLNLEAESEQRNNAKDYKRETSSLWWERFETDEF